MLKKEELKSGILAIITLLFLFWGLTVMSQDSIISQDYRLPDGDVISISDSISITHNPVFSTKSTSGTIVWKDGTQEFSTQRLHAVAFRDPKEKNHVLYLEYGNIFGRHPVRILLPIQDSRDQSGKLLLTLGGTWSRCESRKNITFLIVDWDKGLLEVSSPCWEGTYHWKVETHWFNYDHDNGPIWLPLEDDPPTTKKS